MSLFYFTLVAWQPDNLVLGVNNYLFDLTGIARTKPASGHSSNLGKVKTEDIRAIGRCVREHASQAIVRNPCQVKKLVFTSSTVVCTQHSDGSLILSGWGGVT
jgi:hypothetical protein